MSDQAIIEIVQYVCGTIGALGFLFTFYKVLTHGH